MNIFGIGLPEMAVIAAIGLLVFGPKRLPELGKTLGRTIRGFQSASQEFEKEFRGAIATVNEEALIAERPSPDSQSGVAPELSSANAVLPAASSSPGPTDQLAPTASTSAESTPAPPAS
ncbi:MAG: TatA/E family twin arginine-targeting protein translocase [Prochlorococcaceae cyanobacterium]